MKPQEGANQLQPPALSDRVKWGKYEFAREPFAKVSEGALAFIEANYAETGQFQEHVPLDVDWDSFFLYERQGQLKSYALYTNDEMIGYAVFLLTPTLHAKSTLHAMSDVIYIAPKYRQNYVGIKFIQFCENDLKAAGAKVVHIILKVASAGRALERYAYKIFEVTYMKVL